MARVNCNYCGGRLREDEIFLRYNKKYWCNSCLSTQKSRKMKCPGCKRRGTLAFSYGRFSTIVCTKPYCPVVFLTFITYHYDHPQFPEIIGTIQNFRSGTDGFRHEN